MLDTSEADAPAARLESILETLEAARQGDAALPRFRSLAAELQTMPRHLRDEAWLRARILHLCLARRNPSEAHELLQKLRDQHAEAGTPEVFAAFDARIEALLHPDILTPHGFSRPFARRNHDEIWQATGQLMDRLAALGHRVFLNSGTLLGVIRDGGLLPHDDDIDLVLLFAAADYAEAAEHWFEIRAELEAEGLVREEVSFSPGCKLDAGGVVEVDLFPGWFDRMGTAHIYPYSNGALYAEHILPLRPCAVTGHPLPRNPERVLACNYGEGWRTPDPLYRFPWKQQKRRFRPFRDALGLRQSETSAG